MAHVDCHFHRRWYTLYRIAGNRRGGDLERLSARPAGTNACQWCSGHRGGGVSGLVYSTGLVWTHAHLGGASTMLDSSGLVGLCAFRRQHRPCPALVGLRDWRGLRLIGTNAH